MSVEINSHPDNHQDQPTNQVSNNDSARVPHMTKDKVSECLHLAPSDATGVMIVDLDALASNWRSLSKLVAPAKCAAVVKANAYGLGAEYVIPCLVKAGCDVFFVATLKEAHQTRKLAPAATVYILDGILPGTAKLIEKSGATPVISSLEEAREWSACALSHGPDADLPCALNLDTGLNRLGFDARSLRTLAVDSHLLASLDVKLIMSHMACADEPDHPMNKSQRDIFEGLRPLVPTAPESLAASDGLMLGSQYHYDLVRPGYALYGGQAFKGTRTPVVPVVSSYAKVLQVRDVVPGHAVGYSATYKVTRQSRIAVLSLGYADGFSRQLSSCSQQPNETSDTQRPTPCVAFNGHKAPIIGRVSMDLITVDITDLEEENISRGHWAEIIGPTISLEEYGSAAETIGYEMLTRLGHRFHHLYLDQDSPIKNSKD